MFHPWLDYPVNDYDWRKLLRSGWLVKLWILLIGAIGLGGCSMAVSTVWEPPGKHWLVREQLVIHSDFTMPVQHRLLEDLTARRFDLSRALGVPVSNEPIHIYLFDDADQFGQFIGQRYPDFPQRRAFFIETDTRLVVYAHWGDRVAEDLRHEVTHGYLHAMVPNMPLWLDEGFAEYSEGPRSQAGVNRAHLRRLLARLKQDSWQPDLQRLERLQSTFDMTQDDYAECWAWTHFLLHSHRENHELLRRFLAELRQEGRVEPLSVWLGSATMRPETPVARQPELLVQHLWQLDGQAASR